MIIQLQSDIDEAVKDQQYSKAQSLKEEIDHQTAKQFELMDKIQIEQQMMEVNHTH